MVYATEILTERGFAAGMACSILIATVTRASFSAVKYSGEEQLDSTYTGCLLAFALMSIIVFFLLL